jgi:hypothetical protein
MSNNSTISDFQDISHPQQEVRPSDPLSPDEATIGDVDLPERDFEWASEVQQILDDTLAVVQPENPVTIRDSELWTGSVGYVVAGLNEYLDEFGDRKVETPSSLDIPDEEIDTYIAKVSTEGQSTVPSGERWGKGISPERLRQAITLAVDGQSYRASEVTITACGKYGFIVEYRGDAFALSTTNIDEPEGTVATTDIDGITIRNEEDPAILKGFRLVKRAIEQGFDFNITSFKKRTADKLVFETDHPNGKPIWFTGNQLKRATNPTQNLEELAGEYEYEAWHTDETVQYEFDPDELRHTPGEFADSKETKWVLGYQKYERRRTRGLRHNEYGIGVRVLAQPYYLKIRPDAYENRIDTRIYGSNGKERITKAAFSEPDHRNPSELESPELGFGW